MARVIVTHKVEDVAKWKSFDAERQKNIGAFADNVESFCDVNGGNLVGVTMNVTDPEGLEKFMQSETCSALIRKHGVIQPIVTLG